MIPALSQTPFQWFGGKWEMAEWIVEHLPRGQTLVITHGGSGSPLWHVEHYPVEVFNDIDGELVNFFRVCREQPKELADQLELTPYSKEEWAKSIIPSGDPLEHARQFAVLARQSMGGAPGRAWSSVVTHSRRGMGSSNSRWLHMPETVREIGLRLRTVQIDEMDARECVKKYDRPTTVFYCDPPYHPDVRTPNVYRCEMLRFEHEQLLDQLALAKGAVVLSGYDHPLYNEKLASWKRVEREVTCRSNVTSKGTTAKRPTRTEVLWIKPAAGGPA